jgi:hypothetical protein
MSSSLLQYMCTETSGHRQRGAPSGCAQVATADGSKKVRIHIERSMLCSSCCDGWIKRRRTCEIVCTAHAHVVHVVFSEAREAL